MNRHVASVCIGLLMANPCLAYGGWKTNSLAGLFGEVLPVFVVGLLLSLVPYVVCSIVMEKTRYFYVPLIANILYTICLVGVLMAAQSGTGERGPGHVVFRFATAAAVIFPALLLTKFGIITIFGCRQEKAGRDAEAGATED